MSDTWTIKAALDWTEGYLENKGDENPRLSAQWLLSEATGLSRIELYARFDQPLSMPERDVLRSIVARRGAGEPLQYITGEVGFRHITVKVRPGVLIPRPETEVLVSEALGLLPVIRRRSSEWEAGSAEEEDVLALSEDQLQESSVHRDEPGKEGTEGTSVIDEKDASDTPSSEILVADLCTGSGCIACSIAHEYDQARVVATDIDPTAIELAQENAQLLGLSDRINIIACDLGEGIPDHEIGNFDLIVSNPPYIPTAVLTEIPREVADFEPSLALDGGEDGLDAFRKIATWSFSALKTSGSLVVELHEDCLEKAAQLAREAGFISTRIVDDLAQRPRILIAKKLV